MSARQNHAPVVSFKRKPWYLNPTDQLTIQFTNYSTDPDGDPLTYRWLVDSQPASSEKDYSARLPVGEHLIELEASDVLTKTAITQAVTVEPDQIYPRKPLHIRYKGVCYSPGFRLTGASPLPEDQMDEELGVIANELGCNAVRIFGDNDELLLKCGLIALTKAFDSVALAPRYIDSTIGETVQKVADFARKAENLKESSSKVQLWVGNELTIDARGIREGATYNDRAAANDPPNMPRVLNGFLRDLISASRKEFHGNLSYSAGFWEPVDWNQIGADIVGSNEYFWPERDNINEKIVSLKKHGKPVYITEFGSSTFKGACQWGGGGFFHYNGAPYDEDTQANCVENYLKIFNQTKPDGCFLWEYKEQDAQFMGIVTPPEIGSSKRKKSFYMYKSYQRAS